jgi:hypothetical protein
MSKQLYIWNNGDKGEARELYRGGVLVAVVTHDGPRGTWGNVVFGPQMIEVSSAELMTLQVAKADALRTAREQWDDVEPPKAKMPPEKTIRRYRQNAPVEFAEGTWHARRDGAERGNPYPAASLEGRAWLTGYRMVRAEKERRR